MQRISESAESLFGDLHKPFSTASVESGPKPDVRVESDLASIADVGRAPRHVAEVPIVLQKSFYTGDQKFCGLQARLSCKDVRDLIALC
jgi:hypothetical protein